METTAPEKVNILMVDDQPGKLLSYEVMLGELNENLLKATSGREALERLLETDVAVVLMDVSMPEIDGFELADMIRQHPRFQKTAIIFISAVRLTDLDRLKGYERGAVDYLSVPVVPELLRAKVSVFAEMYRKTRQLDRVNRELERRVIELKFAEQGLRKLSGRLMQTQDQERRRIARELHDGLAQHLIASKMTLSMLSMGTELGKNASAYLADATEQLDRAIAETRTMSYLLHPPLLDETGLKSAVAWYAEGFAKRSGIQITVDISPTLGRLERDAETALFRVLQECLTNIHRHSGSTSASIRLIHEADEIRLEVIDRGKGFPVPPSDPTGLPPMVGIGLQGIRERMRQLQGRMEITSQNGSGATVLVAVPDSARVNATSDPCEAEVS